MLWSDNLENQSIYLICIFWLVNIHISVSINKLSEAGCSCCIMFLVSEQKLVYKFWSDDEPLCQDNPLSLAHSSSCCFSARPSSSLLFHLPEAKFRFLILWQTRRYRKVDWTWWFLWNFSKFAAIIGIGRDKTSTPATAHMLPNNFPNPDLKYF